MAIRGVSLAEREEITLPHDPSHPKHPDCIKALKEGRDPGEPTKFFIGNLTKACRIEVGDLSTSPTMKDGGVTMELRRTKRAYTIVQRGLAGWENMLDHSGKVAKFELSTIQTGAGFVKAASDAAMQQLSVDDIDALARAILDKNGMTRQAEGNSGTQSLPFGDLLSGIGDATTVEQTSSENEDAPQPQ